MRLHCTVLLIVAVVIVSTNASVDVDDEERMFSLNKLFKGSSSGRGNYEPLPKEGSSEPSTGNYVFPPTRHSSKFSTADQAAMQALAEQSLANVKAATKVMVEKQLVEFFKKDYDKVEGMVIMHNNEHSNAVRVFALLRDLRQDKLLINAIDKFQMGKNEPMFEKYRNQMFEEWRRNGVKVDELPKPYTRRWHEEYERYLQRNSES